MGLLPSPTQDLTTRVPKSTTVAPGPDRFGPYTTPRGTGPYLTSGLPPAAFVIQKPPSTGSSAPLT
jgi:hypothetical protein